jgi:HSP20 family protein
MALTKWHPAPNSHGLHHQTNYLFDDMVREEPGFGMFSKMQETPWMPGIELRETATELIILAQVPGLEPEKLDIQMSNSSVFLAGEYIQQTAAEQVLRSDFHYGRFARTVPLPSTIQQDRVTATIVDGLLTLTMPKAMPHTPNMVRVSLVKTVQAEFIIS